MPQQNKAGFTLRIKRGVLLFSILMSGFCGILSELCLFNLANTLIGGMNIVLTYTMGVMMFFMGLGALTVKLKRFGKNLVSAFIWVETLLSVATGTSVIAIYYFASVLPAWSLGFLLIYSACIGYLIGFEIPLILLINEKLEQPLQDNSALVFAADYLGSLIAFVLFSHWMLTHLGLAQSATAGALINWAVSLLAGCIFINRLKSPKRRLSLLTLIGMGLAILLYSANPLLRAIEAQHFRHGILLNAQSEYQKITLTHSAVPGNKNYDAIRTGFSKNLFTTMLDDSNTLSIKRLKAPKGLNDIRLFLNGALQFSTIDEYIYHEMLVHPVMWIQNNAKKVLVAGGGDGMAVRELVKYPYIEDILVVELDPAMNRLFTHHPFLAGLNDSSFHDKRVRLLNTDIFTFLKSTPERYDAIILDLPDPRSYELAKLYSRQMYQLCKERLNSSGALAVQSTSPYFTRQSYLTIRKTLSTVFDGNIVSYKQSMPTFGLWGFHLAAIPFDSLQLKQRLDNFHPRVPCRFINRESMQAAHRWGKNMLEGWASSPVNEWNKPLLVRLYLQEAW